MTERPLRRLPPGHRALRVFVLVGVAVAAVVGVVFAVTLLPEHHASAPKPAAAASATASQSPSPSPSPSLDVAPSSATSTAAVSGTASQPATNASSAPNDAQAALKAQVVAAELAFQATLAQELDSNTGNLTPLFAVATGQALSNAEDAVAKLRSQGRTQRGAPTITDATVVSVASPTVAVVSACEDDSTARIVDAKTGALIDQLHERYTTTTTMVLLGGSWKASTSSSGGAC
jgi:cytoskeletal protein RodZ